MTGTAAGLILLTAHLIGDFVVGGELETWNRRAHSWLRAGVHALLHGALVLALLGAWGYWSLAAAVAVSHLVIDELERWIGKPSFASFLWDQVAHLAVILGLAALAPSQPPGIWDRLLGPFHLPALVLTAGGLSAVLLGGEVVGWLVQPFAQQLPPREDRPPASRADRSDEPARGFPQGGRTIGYLERALIFLLVLAGEVGAVGFLVAAKSVFRFGELRERSNRVEAEYILIGTLASFLWGLAVAYLTTLALAQF